MEAAELVKSSVDIVRVVGEYVQLRRVGSGPRYVGLCPFHNEKTPSFSVHSVHQFYKCFGCGAGGDVFRFVMERDGISFFEALKLLAERYGIALPQRAEYADPESRLRGAIFEMHEAAARVFREALQSPAGTEARGYLEKRGVSASASEEFGLGVADRAGQALVRRFQKQGFTQEQMEASGLVIRRQDGSGYFDRFRGRLMFPIHNESGKVIGFGGRAMAAGDEPKYLNSSESPIYRKSHVLYNLHRAREAARKQGHFVLVEGYMDVIGVFAAGVREVVASCGTALTPNQARMMRRHCERIVVNFDPDAAGANATERSVQMLLEEGLHIRVLELEGGLDPDEYVKQHGAEAYRARLEKAGGYFHWLADRTRRRFDTRTAEGRAAGFQVLLPSIQRISDKFERMATANEVAEYLGVDSKAVLEEFRKLAGDRRQKTVRPMQEPVRPVEKILLNSLLAEPSVCAEVLPRLRGLGPVEQFVTRRIFQALLALEESGVRPSFSELQSRLSEEDKTLLSSVVFADVLGEHTAPLEQALDCVRILEMEDRESQRTELQSRVKAAERAGKFEEALRWTEQLTRLGRR